MSFRAAAIRRVLLLTVGGGVMLQFAGCVGSLVPGAIAAGEQFFLSVLADRLFNQLF